MPDQQTPVQSRWRTVKVFISSTFRDMYAERDHLVKVVFPALRERLGKYRVHLIDIDLRWGVTKEQADNDRVLDLCLDQIHDCRPFFIGILGERYGWVPKKFLPEAIRKYGWVQHETGKSLTELEILHGVLNNPDMKGHAFFYFRDPKALNKIPDKIKDIYVESDPVRINKLIVLKERIRHSGHPVMDPYPARWDPEAYDRYTKAKGRLTGLKEFGDRIQEQLWEGIKGELKLPDKPPTDTETDPLAIEQDYHERFIDLRLNVYVGRDKIHDDLLTYLDGDDRRPLVVTGPSGSGKSAILARLSREGAQKDIDTLVIPFFIGASPSSTTIRSVHEYLCNVIKKKFSLAPEIPAEADKLITTFRSFLFSIPENKRLVIIIDAINQLDETGHPEELAWLPEELAPNVRIVLSCIDEFGHKNRFIERAREMKIAEKEVDELTNDERIEIIRKVPSVSAKTLDEDQIKMLLDNPATKNPLYLLIALEELRGFGSFDELNKRISEFPKPDNQGGDVIQAIFGQVIRRLEEEFDRELVSTVLSLLASARRGLSENELTELVVDLSGKGDLFPVLRQLRTYLMERGEIIDFFHRGLYKAIHSLYLKDDEDRKVYHLRLANYFKTLELFPLSKGGEGVVHNPRKVDELPWQLAQAQAWEWLYDLLAHLPFFEAAWRANEFEVKAYWARVEDNSSFRMVEACKYVLNAPEKFALECIWLIAHLLNDAGHPFESLSLRKYLLDCYRQKNDFVHLQASLGNLACILIKISRLNDAMEYLKEQESICLKIEDKDGLQSCFGNQAVILQTKGKLEDAMLLLERQLNICREIVNKESIQNCLGNQAIVYKIRGEFERAMNLLKKKERICRELGNIDGVRVSLGNQAIILKDIGKFKEAMELHKEEENICRKLGDKNGLAISFGNQAVILHALGKFDDAIGLHKKKAEICREIKYINGLVLSLINQAIILAGNLHRQDESLPLAEEAYQLAKNCGYTALVQQIKPIYDSIKCNR